MTAVRLEAHQCIGFGTFATVYRISPRRVVKVFSALNFSNAQRDGLIADEVHGGDTLPMALPVLRVLDVEIYCVYKRQQITTRGLLKRYLPFGVTEAMLHGVRAECAGLFDAKAENFRMDSRGNIFLVDTQTAGCQSYIPGGSNDRSV